MTDLVDISIDNDLIHWPHPVIREVSRPVGYNDDVSHQIDFLSGELSNKDYDFLTLSHYGTPSAVGVMKSGNNIIPIINPIFIHMDDEMVTDHYENDILWRGDTLLDKSTGTSRHAAIITPTYRYKYVSVSHSEGMFNQDTNTDIKDHITIQRMVERMKGFLSCDHGYFSKELCKKMILDLVYTDEPVIVTCPHFFSMLYMKRALENINVYYETVNTFDDTHTLRVHGLRTRHMKAINQFVYSFKIMTEHEYDVLIDTSLSNH